MEKLSNVNSAWDVSWRREWADRFLSRQHWQECPGALLTSFQEVSEGPMTDLLAEAGFRSALCVPSVCLRGRLGGESCVLHPFVMAGGHSLVWLPIR